MLRKLGLSWGLMIVFWEKNDLESLLYKLMTSSMISVGVGCLVNFSFCGVVLKNIMNSSKPIIIIKQTIALIYIVK